MTDQPWHEAFLFATDAQFLDVVVPYLQAGVDAGQQIAVACRNGTWDAVRAASGFPADVTRLPGGETPLRAASRIRIYQEQYERSLAGGAQGLRLLTEAPAGADHQRWTQWLRYEAAVNDAFESLAYCCMCAYDTRSLPAWFLDMARLSHPGLRVAGELVVNEEYLTPSELLASDEQYQDGVHRAPDLRLDVVELAGLRRALEAAIRERLGALPKVAEELLIAANEIASNALRHGRPPVVAKLWTDEDRLVATITDQGFGFADPVAGYAVPTARFPEGRMGLWVARQTADEMCAKRTAEGFTVRVASYLADGSLPEPAESASRRVPPVG